MIITRGFKFGIGLLLSAVLAGCSCAKQADLDATRAEAQEARRIAEQALNTANESRQLSQDTDSRAKKVEEAMNRSFKKSMYK